MTILDALGGGVRRRVEDGPSADRVGVQPLERPRAGRRRPRREGRGGPRDRFPRGRPTDARDARRAGTEPRRRAEADGRTGGPRVQVPTACASRPTSRRAARSASSPVGSRRSAPSSPSSSRSSPGPSGRSRRSSRASACPSTRTPTRSSRSSRYRGGAVASTTSTGSATRCRSACSRSTSSSSRGTPVYGKPFPERRALLEKALNPTERVRLAVQRVVIERGGGPELLRRGDRGRRRGDHGQVPRGTGAPTARAPAGSGGSSTSASTPPASPTRSMAWWWAGSRGAAGGPVGTGPSCSPSTTRSSTGSRPSARSAPGSTTPSSPRCPSRLHRYEVDERPPEVVTGRNARPVDPAGVVLEVRGAELTLSPVHRAGLGAIRPAAGLALRFPRFTGRFRDDRSATEATTTGGAPAPLSLAGPPGDPEPARRLELNRDGRGRRARRVRLGPKA